MAEILLNTDAEVEFVKCSDGVANTCSFLAAESMAIKYTHRKYRDFQRPQVYYQIPQ